MCPRQPVFSPWMRHRAKKSGATGQSLLPVAEAQAEAEAERLEVRLLHRLRTELQPPPLLLLEVPEVRAFREAHRMERLARRPVEEWRTGREMQPSQHESSL